MEKIVEVTGKLVIQKSAQDWCKFPYPDHPKGCPNYGKKKGCPPTPLVSAVFNLKKPHWFAVVTFDMASHMEAMTSKHPDWSDRQKRCCLYWQGKTRKQLRNLCENWLRQHKSYSHTTSPEAMGVNVFRTAHRCGLKMRKCAYPTVFKVALLAQPLQF